MILNCKRKKREIMNRDEEEEQFSRLPTKKVQPSLQSQPISTPNKREDELSFSDESSEVSVYE